MLSLGAGYGLLYHFIIMPLIGSELVHCLGQGVIFGLINYLMSIGLYKRYHTLKNSNKLLKKKLDIDKLTGLLNRGAFDNDIMGLSLDESYSIIFIDIDNFRKFNNEFGHQVGDLVLQKVSREIRNSIRVSDKAYRYGGEEIVILLKDCNRRKTLEIAEKVRLNINELNNNPYPSITISLGVASYPDDGKHADEIIKASDNALLTAKRLGKNQVSSCAV
ncbi:MAG TPA: GGDEF domain-containing protein [Clostridiales bacterium]|nr:GGDEF domain-containing protein [Clostridiales bacterium]